MLLRIHHETRFHYSEPVSETIFETRMAPQSDEDQTVLGYRLRTAPRGPVTSFRDGYANRVDLFNLTTPYRELVIQATSIVRTHRRLGAAGLAGTPWPGPRPLPFAPLAFLRPSTLVGPSPAVDAFVASLPPPSGTLADVTRSIMEAVRNRLEYVKQSTGAQTNVDEALAMGRGVCQDFAHLFIAGCRGIGLPARYVSGYVHQPGELHTHAWCQVWAGGDAGWVDVDPTHRVYPEDDHVVTAVGADYADVPPNRGLYRGRATEQISVSVKVEPIDRVPPQWQEWGASPPRSPSKGPAPPKGGRDQEPRSGRRLGVDPGLGHRPDPPPALRQQQGQQQQAITRPDRSQTEARRAQQDRRGRSQDS